MAVTHLMGKEVGTVVCCTKGKSMESTTLLEEVTCKRCLKIINTPSVVEKKTDTVIDGTGEDFSEVENLAELDSPNPDDVEEDAETSDLE
jgi:hypothetical protein